MVQGKGMMSTYWLIGKDSSKATGQNV